MGDVITAIMADVTAADLFGVLTGIVPWIAVLIVVSLGFYLFRRSVKGAQKGKARF